MVIHNALVARLRKLSIVPRWTIVPTINQQNTAEHSFHVAWIALWLGMFNKRRDTENFERDILLYSILHDSSESVSGDVPATFKHALKSHYDFKALDDGFLPDVPELVKQTVKMADYIEALLFLTEEHNTGNLRVHGIYHDVLKNAENVWKEFEWCDSTYGDKPELLQILHRLCQMIEGANIG